VKNVSDSIGVPVPEKTALITCAVTQPAQQTPEIELVIGWRRGGEFVGETRYLIGRKPPLACGSARASMYRGNGAW